MSGRRLKSTIQQAFQDAVSNDMCTCRSVSGDFRVENMYSLNDMK
jgi:hypothetical protein